MTTCSLFGRIRRQQKSFRNYLSFRMLALPELNNNSIHKLHKNGVPTDERTKLSSNRKKILVSKLNGTLNNKMHYLFFPRCNASFNNYKYVGI